MSLEREPAENLGDLAIELLWGMKRLARSGNGEVKASLPQFVRRQLSRSAFELEAEEVG
jgi:hypothetical protein